MGKFLALPGINAKLTCENNSDRKQIFLLAMSAAAVLHGHRTISCSSPGVSEIEK